MLFTHNHNPDQAGLKSLIQVMGVLCIESALSLLLRFDHQSQLYAAENKSLRKKVLKDINPPSTSIALQKCSGFSKGLFPEKEFKEVNLNARKLDTQSFFRKLQRRTPPSSKPGTVHRLQPLRGRDFQVPWVKKP